MLAQRDGLRLSLAGAQDKLPVVFDGERIGLPRGDTASTHILKPAIAAVEGSVFNEAFCMGLGQPRRPCQELLTSLRRQGANTRAALRPALHSGLSHAHQNYGDETGQQDSLQ